MHIIIGIAPTIIVMGIPVVIMRVMASQRSRIASIWAGSLGTIRQIMPSLPISIVTLPIIGAGIIPPIVGIVGIMAPFIPFIMGIIPPIMGIMAPFIMGIIPPIMGIMAPFIMGIIPPIMAPFIMGIMGIIPPIMGALGIGMLCIGIELDMGFMGIAFIGMAFMIVEPFAASPISKARAADNLRTMQELLFLRRNGWSSCASGCEPLPPPSQVLRSRS